jgi:hypothetical protein
MKHTHESLAANEQTLEEDIIIPHRRKVFEGGGLSMERKGAPATDSPRPVRAKQERGTTTCLCGVTISAHRTCCRACAESMGVLV